MSKRANTYELALRPRDRREPAYRWLGAALRDNILRGQLRPGGRLPATRDLAHQYGLSRGTVVRAFEELKAEGYLEGTIGSGTYVSRVLPVTCCPLRQASRLAPRRRSPRADSRAMPAA